jgi:hypothetical protein
MPFSSVSEKPGLRYVTNACFTGREWSFRELRSQSPISPCRHYRSDQPENLGCADCLRRTRMAPHRVICLCRSNLRDGDEYYLVMAVEYQPYELVSPELMRGLKILKAPADRK